MGCYNLSRRKKLPLERGKNEIFVIWSQDYGFLVLGSSVDYCKCLKIDEDVVTSKMIEKIRETIGNKEIKIVNDLCGYV